MKKQPIQDDSSRTQRFRSSYWLTTLRGGDWKYGISQNMRVWNRDSSDPKNEYNDTGFRVVRNKR